MKKFPSLLFALFILTGIVTLVLIRYRDKNCRSNLIYVDFDVSMQSEKYSEVIKKAWGKDVMNILREVYARNNFLKVPVSTQYKIPRKVRQIWIQGEENLPQEFRELRETIKSILYDWDYKMLSDQDIRELKYFYLIKDMYDAAPNYGEKADLARYAFLLEGGVYIDVDFELFKRLDDLNKAYDFYVSLHPLDTDIVQIGNAFIGAAPEHPIIRCVLDNLPYNKNIRQTVVKTGPIFFTRIICSIIARVPGVNIVLPASYLFSRGYEDKREAKNEWLKPESFAAHHWAGSWMKPEAFVKN